MCRDFSAHQEFCLLQIQPPGWLINAKKGLLLLINVTLSTGAKVLFKAQFCQFALTPALCSALASACNGPQRMVIEGPKISNQQD